MGADEPNSGRAKEFRGGSADPADEPNLADSSDLSELADADINKASKEFAQHYPDDPSIILESCIYTIRVADRLEKATYSMSFKVRATETPPASGRPDSWLYWTWTSPFPSSQIEPALVYARDKQERCSLEARPKRLDPSDKATVITVKYLNRLKANDVYEFTLEWTSPIYLKRVEGAKHRDLTIHLDYFISDNACAHLEAAFELPLRRQVLQSNLQSTSNDPTTDSLCRHVETGIPANHMVYLWVLHEASNRRLRPAMLWSGSAVLSGVAGEFVLRALGL